MRSQIGLPLGPRKSTGSYAEWLSRNSPPKFQSFIHFRFCGSFGGSLCVTGETARQPPTTPVCRRGSPAERPKAEIKRGGWHLALLTLSHETCLHKRWTAVRRLSGRQCRLRHDATRRWARATRRPSLILTTRRPSLILRTDAVSWSDQRVSRSQLNFG
jgi:hypothetical protein